METVRIATSQNIDIDYEVAGLGERIVAGIIDTGLFILTYILCIIVAVSTGLNKPSLIICNIVYLSLYVFYDLVCEAFLGGQTIGKRIMKIKVISLDGGQPSFGQYLMRWIFRIVDSLLTMWLGAIISIAVSEKHQRIGDIVAGTTLIKTSQRTRIDHVAYIPEDSTYEPVFKEAVHLSEKDIAIIQEVINNYIRTRNTAVVNATVMRITGHLNIINRPYDMNDLQFLRTIVKDYGHLSVQAENA